MFDTIDGMRAYLHTQGWSLENERLFVGRFCSFFTQQNKVYGLSSVADGGRPEFRGHVLEDGKLLLIFPVSQEADTVSTDQISFDFDIASAAEAWGIIELAFLPGACFRVQEMELVNPCEPEMDS